MVKKNKFKFKIPEKPKFKFPSVQPIFKILYPIFQDQFEDEYYDFLPEGENKNTKKKKSKATDLLHLATEKLLELIPATGIEKIFINPGPHQRTPNKNLQNIATTYAENIGNHKTIYFRHYTENPDELFYNINKCIKPESYIKNKEKYILENPNDNLNLNDINHIRNISLHFTISILLIDRTDTGVDSYTYIDLKETTDTKLVIIYMFKNKDTDKVNYEPVIHIDIKNPNKLHFNTARSDIKTHFLNRKETKVIDEELYKIGDKIKSDQYDNKNNMKKVEIDSPKYGKKEFYLGRKIRNYRNIYTIEPYVLAGKVYEIAGKNIYNVRWCKNNNGLNK